MTYLQKAAGMADGEQQLTKKVVNRRSQLEIRMDILRAIMEGAEGPTQIMYKANLSWILLCEHLSALGEQGFVGEKAVGNRKKYSLTGKGIEIVGAYLNLIREIIFDTAQAPM
jgi:predicted transcriptional regulator